MAYQEDALAAHKRRMAYNPMEASKNKLRVSHPTSKYNQDDQPRGPAESLAAVSRSQPHFSPSKSAANVRPSRFDNPVRFAETKMSDPKLAGFSASSTFMLFGEKMTLTSTGGVKEMTSMPLHRRDKTRSKSGERVFPKAVVEDRPSPAPRAAPEFSSTLPPARFQPLAPYQERRSRPLPLAAAAAADEIPKFYQPLPAQSRSPARPQQADQPREPARR